MDREEIIRNLRSYYSEWEEETRYIGRFLDLLTYTNCYERSLEFGHITASAWVTNEMCDEVLLLHHRKLDRWLQPGGHADGEENVIVVARKELTEETGLKSVKLKSDGIFDIDIHGIPEHKGVPAHEHFDVRFHFIAFNPVEIHGNSESKGLKWFKVSEVADVVNHEMSIKRMLSKTNICQSKN